MNLTDIPTETIDRIAELLDRLDPAGGACDVPGCVHHAAVDPRNAPGRAGTV